MQIQIKLQNKNTYLIISRNNYMPRYNNGIIYGKKKERLSLGRYDENMKMGKEMAMGSYFLRLSGQNIHIYYSAYFCKH